MMRASSFALGLLSGSLSASIPALAQDFESTAVFVLSGGTSRSGLFLDVLGNEYYVDRLRQDDCSMRLRFAWPYDGFRFFQFNNLSESKKPKLQKRDFRLRKNGTVEATFLSALERPFCRQLGGKGAEACGPATRVTIRKEAVPEWANSLAFLYTHLCPGRSLRKEAVDQVKK